MKLFYTDRAKDDLGSAFSWYERQRRGLGYEYLDCVENAVKSLLDYPEMCQKCYGAFRACIVRRFPFSIFYTLEDHQIVVHAVLDNRRNPKHRP